MDHCYAWDTGRAEFVEAQFVETPSGRWSIQCIECPAVEIVIPI
jgi:hypothetical protein